MAPHQRLGAGGDGYPLGGGRNTVGQANVPTLLALVHSQYDAGGTGRVVGRSIQQQKVWPQLSNSNTVARQQQVDPYIGGMTAVAGEHGTYR